MAWVVLALLTPVLHGLPTSPSTDSFQSISSSSKPQHSYNSTNTSLNDEFTGLTVRYNHRRTQRNEFSLESLAITAIHALKESALEDYNAALLDYHFVDSLPPEEPIRIAMHHVPRADPALTRKNIMWTIKNLTMEMAHSDLLYELPFRLQLSTRDLYLGIIANPDQADSLSPPASPVHPLSLTAIPSPRSTTLLVPNASSPRDVTVYVVNFEFTGDLLPEISIFESILSLLLQLGRVHALAHVERVVMEEDELQAQIYMEEISPPLHTYNFYQYHAVALLEAVARYYVQHRRWTEMTFELVMDGHLVAWGCVVEKTEGREGCRDMFPDGRADVGELATTS
ncbi:MAG: hypothetical protein L6R40_002618 [Gallowayella cf. fulva]|nr:MAG: hypothetical protein L6R40_002618 [Xanthomendoza cf. fulva]